MSEERYNNIELNGEKGPNYVDVRHIEVPLHPDLDESVVQITEPESKCYPECPIIKLGISKIMVETDKAVVQSLVRWVENIHDACNVGPRVTQKPRFIIFGAKIVEITCGSQLSENHLKQRTARICNPKL